MDSNPADGPSIESVELGRSGLVTSSLGFGTGGLSRAGLGQGIDHAAGLVSQAIDLGLGLIDTAEDNGTEETVALGVQRSGQGRSKVVLSTKVSYRVDDRLRTPGQVDAAIDERLLRLATDRIDILWLHSVMPEHYERVRDEILPVLQRRKESGEIGLIGITEAFRHDAEHAALTRAVEDPVWDAIMVGFSLLNQSARADVISPASEAGVGVIGMYAVRQVLRDPESLRRYLATLAARGGLPAAFDVDDRMRRLVVLLERSGLTLPELAYRFVATEPHVDAVLMGTGDPDHLRENVRLFAKGPLEPDVYEPAAELFADCVGLVGEQPKSTVRRMLGHVKWRSAVALRRLRNA